MGSTSTFLAVLVVFLIALNVGQYYYWTQVHEEEEEGALQIPDLFGGDWSNWEDFVGEEVQVQGYYVNASGPMLVSSLDLVLLNLEMPNDTYLPLIGDIKINSTKYSGSLVEVDGIVRASSEEKSRYPSPDRPVIEFRGYKVISPSIYPYYSFIRDIIIIPPQFYLPDRYAVLISGGIDAGNNHYRYWNDMKFMYSVLINEYSYEPDNIKVIYADGVALDAQMPVNYSATVANIQTVFNELQAKMTWYDTLFIYTNDHGSGFWPADPYGVYLRSGRVDLGGDEVDFFSEATYNKDFNSDGDKVDTLAFDEALNLWGNAKLYDDDLAAMLDAFGDNYARIIVVMEQCFSGGFVRDLSGPNRVILTACGEHEPSWSADTEGTYNEFTYHFMSAVNGQTPGGVAVDADTDGISGISMVEAFNYASTHDSRGETPLYDDDGNGVGHAAPIVPPVSGPGEGAIGKYTYL